MALDLVVSGATGRMGRALARLIQEAEDLRVLGGIAPDADPADTGAAPGAGYPEIVPVEDAGELVRRAEVVIDFSAPEQLARLIDHCAEPLAGKALLVGTTGFDDDLHQRLRELSDSVAVLVAPNFSVGVNVLLGLVEHAARALSADAYDIEITETHHGRKEDAPSGTALALARAAARGRDRELEQVRRDGRSGRTGTRPEGEIGLHALRGGGVAGEHIVHLLGERERIALSHNALDRDLFADGTLVAARWMATRGPGWYGMADVLGI
jgi:4-hydroxy-tetrahydrodipicolinate reductase